jgi:hypothetical protein
MMKQLLGGLAAAALVVGFSASAAHAQCAFQHPKKAGGFQSSFVQAFVSCGNLGGNSPNTSAGGGAAPACKPPETFTHQNGSPSTGWTWGLKGQGSIKLKAVKNSGGVLVVSGGPVNGPIPITPANSSNVKIQVKLKDIEYPGGGGPVTVSGTLTTLTRTTFKDTSSGDVTVVDFPVNFVLPMFNGNAKLKTSADTQLNADTLAALPHCTSLETVQISILDENGDTFANAGLFMPDAP